MEFWTFLTVYFFCSPKRMWTWRLCNDYTTDILSGNYSSFCIYSNSKKFRHNHRPLNLALLARLFYVASFGEYLWLVDNNSHPYVKYIKLLLVSTGHTRSYEYHQRIRDWSKKRTKYVGGSKPSCICHFCVIAQHCEIAFLAVALKTLDSLGYGRLPHGKNQITF